jgi:hypothetical protein
LLGFCRCGIVAVIGQLRRSEGTMARKFASTVSPADQSSSGARTPGASPPVVEPNVDIPVAKGNFLRPLYLVPHRLTPEERHQRISQLAYKRAAQRGFAPGGEAEDWLDAEREVDAERY